MKILFSEGEPCRLLDYAHPLEENRISIPKCGTAALLVFSLGVILRVTLALINWSAYSVIRVIADENPRNPLILEETGASHRSHTVFHLPI